MAKPTGGKPGRPRVYSGRDEFVFWTVEWVMGCGQKLVALDYLSRPLGLGRGSKEENIVALDACVVAAWLLSGGEKYDDHLTEPLKRQIYSRWLLEFPKVAAAMDAAGIPDGATFSMQAGSIREVYKRVKAQPPRAERPSINREDLAERKKISKQLDSRGPYVGDDGACHSPGGCLMHLVGPYPYREVQCPAFDDGEGFPPQNT